MEPLVSIIIPCYNAAPFLRQCLESVRLQTYQHLEVICVNDGSTDETADVLESLRKRDARFRIISQTNQGISSARNIGILNAQGVYLAFVDSDDWLHEEYVAKMVSCSVDRVLVCTSYERVWKNTVKVRDIKLTHDTEVAYFLRRIVGLAHYEMADPSQADSLVTVWGKLYLAETIKVGKIQFISTEEIGNEDALFNIEYLAKFWPNDQVYVLNEPLYHYRKSDQSFTNRYRAGLFEKWLRLFEKIGAVVADRGIEYERALKNRICLSIIGLGLNEMNSSESPRRKKKNLRKILNNPEYQKAFSVLHFSYFPWHWKLFFMAAKKRHVNVLFYLLRYINKRVSNG